MHEPHVPRLHMVKPFGPTRGRRCCAYHGAEVMCAHDDRGPGHVMEFSVDSGMAPRPRPDAVDFWMDHEGPIP